MNRSLIVIFQLNQGTLIKWNVAIKASSISLCTFFKSIFMFYLCFVAQLDLAVLGRSSVVFFDTYRVYVT